MKILISAVFYALIFQSAFSQISIKELNKDQILVENLIENHKRLPQGLIYEIRILDSVLLEICTSSDLVSAEQCEHTREKLKNIREELTRLDKDIQIANNDLTAVSKSLSDCLCAKSTADYLKCRKNILNPKIKEYNRVYSRIKRKEKRLTFQAILYAARNYWSKDQLVTSMISLYVEQKRLDQARLIQEVQWKTVEIDSLNVEKNKLKIESNALLYQYSRLNEDYRVLKDNGQWVQDSIQGELNKLKKRQDELTRRLKGMEETIGNTTEALRISRDSLKLYELQLTQLRNDVVLGEQTLSALSESLSMIKDSLHNTEELLIEKNDTLSKVETQLSDIFRIRDQNDLIVTVLSISLIALLLLALLSQYHRVKSARRGKKQLRVANAKLASTNNQLTEKRVMLEALIGELHHRTKNNLQEISALLYLQAREKDDETLKTAMDEARGRIDAIGIVHRLLYQDKQKRMTTVNLANYIEELVEHLFKVHHYPKESVRTKFNLQQIYIDTDKAIQIGLIVNELVHNCFKHAFPKTKGPELAIGMEALDNELHLAIKDNGPGFPVDMKWGQTNSFGLKLVRQLVKGCHGTIQYKKKNGALFNMILPLAADEYEIAT